MSRAEAGTITVLPKRVVTLFSFAPRRGSPDQVFRANPPGLASRRGFSRPWIDAARTSDRHVDGVVRTRAACKAIRLSESATAGVGARLALPQDMKFVAGKRSAEISLCMQRSGR